ncbi:MAG: type II secretion system F family protein [Verrucomicrobia bacterium]|nr:type II secretion system F family protein [Verrucomicrobiota bacterium]
MNDGLDSLWNAVLSGLWLLEVLGILGFIMAIPAAVFYLLSLPLRRQERARRFLDLLETSLQSGLGVEPALVSISHTGDPTLGPRFHLLAAHLETGLRLEDALARVPQLLPPQIVATLRVGSRLGDLRRVLPACAGRLRDGLSQMRSALNYMVVLLLFLAPIFPALLLMLRTFVFPQFHAIARELGVADPMIVNAFARWSGLFIVLHVALWGLLLALGFIYVAGPRLKARCGLLADRAAFHLPWKRKRLQRDFAGMLATLLDAGTPEPDAVELAARCTDNGLVIAAAARAGEHLAQGAPLGEAIQEVTGARELRWRLENASHHRAGFLSALKGWLEALDARAFQEEQAAAHLFTTGFVLFNGLLVGTCVVAIFSMLVALVDHALLW